MRLAITVFCVSAAMPLLPTQAGAAGARLVHFEPELVQLTGKLGRKAFLVNPGSGRESRELHYVLSLDEPVTVASERGDTRVEAEELQVAASSEEGFETLLGRRVRLTGTLFPGHTRHHFTGVMIFARRAEQAR